MSQETDRMHQLFADMPRIETGRLVLRPLEITDDEAIFAYGSDVEVARYVIFEVHQSIENTRDFLRTTRESRDNRTGAVWGVVLKANDQLIGTVGLHHYDAANNRIETGYALNRTYWNKGYATEAVTALIDTLFTTTDINRIEANCYPPNIASARVMEKSGMKFEGLLRERALVKGVKQDLKMYAVLRSDKA